MKLTRRTFGLKSLLGGFTAFLSGLAGGRGLAQVDHNHAQRAFDILRRYEGSVYPAQSTGGQYWQVWFDDSPQRPGLRWVATYPSLPGRGWPPPRQRLWKDPIEAVLESERLMLNECEVLPPRPPMAEQVLPLT